MEKTPTALSCSNGSGLEVHLAKNLLFRMNYILGEDWKHCFVHRLTTVAIFVLNVVIVFAMAKALSYVLGRIYQVSTAVFELAYAERKNKIQERHHGSLCGAYTKYRGSGTVCKNSDGI